MLRGKLYGEAGFDGLIFAVFALLLEDLVQVTAQTELVHAQLIDVSLLVSDHILYVNQLLQDHVVEAARGVQAVLLCVNMGLTRHLPDHRCLQLVMYNVVVERLALNLNAHVGVSLGLVQRRRELLPQKKV